MTLKNVQLLLGFGCTTLAQKCLPIEGCLYVSRNPTGFCIIACNRGFNRCQAVAASLDGTLRDCAGQLSTDQLVAGGQQMLVGGPGQIRITQCSHD